MSKSLLLEKYIKKAIKKALQEEEQNQRKSEKAMYIIHRFPGLKKSIVDLMSPAFGRYVADINIIAPKPTTFKINLINGQEFTIMYIGHNKFVAKVGGKKYYLANLGETQRASQGIADLLSLNYAPQESKDELKTAADVQKGNDLKADFSSMGSAPSTLPGQEEPSPEENPNPETPPVPGQEPEKPEEEEKPLP